MTVRFDPTGPYEVDETDTPFARPDGAELLARIYRPRVAADRPLGSPAYDVGAAADRLVRWRTLLAALVGWGASALD